MLDFDALDAAEGVGGAEGEEPAVPFPDGPRPFLVMHPHLVVRAAPEIPQGKGVQDIVSIRIRGQVVLAEASKGPWLRLARAEELLFSDSPAGRPGAEDEGAPAAKGEQLGLSSGKSWILAEGDVAGLPGVSLLKPLPGAPQLPPPVGPPGGQPDGPPGVAAAGARAAQLQRLEVRVDFSLRAAASCCLRRRSAVGPAAAEWLRWAGGAPEPLQLGGAALPTCCAALGSGARVEARRALGARGPGAVIGPWRIFAAQDFEPGEEVECCPLLELPGGVDPLVFPGVRLVPLHDEASATTSHALMLGFGSLYRAPMGLHGNLTAAIMDEPGGLPLKAVRLTARQCIRVGEELLLSLEVLEDLRGASSSRTRNPMATYSWPGFPHGASQVSGPGAVPLPGVLARFAPGTPAQAGLPRSWLGEAGNQQSLALRPRVFVGPSTKVPKGRGVFAKRDFRSGEVIELCPCLVLADERASLAVKDYIMEGPRLSKDSAPIGGGSRKAAGLFGPAQKGQSQDEEEGSVVQACVLALGSGCLYNHGRTSELNARWALARDLELVVIQAQEDISEGAEVFISYTDKWWQRRGIAPL